MCIRDDWCNLQCLMGARGVYVPRTRSCPTRSGRQMWRRLPILVRPNMCHCANLALTAAGGHSRRHCHRTHDLWKWSAPGYGSRSVNELLWTAASKISLRKPISTGGGYFNNICPPAVTAGCVWSTQSISCPSHNVLVASIKGGDCLDIKHLVKKEVSFIL